MSDQYVFELQFKGSTDALKSKESQFVIIDGSSMQTFAKLKEDLVKCAPKGKFSVLYVDDEDDYVSIDSEEEFKEFAKLAKQRSSKGLLIKLIVLSKTSKKPSNVSAEINSKDHSSAERLQKLNVMRDRLASLKSKRMVDVKQVEKLQKTLESTKNKFEAMSTTVPGSSCGHMTEENMQKLISDLKKEILAELRSQQSVEAPAQTKDEEQNEEACFEEDSDGNVACLPEKRKLKIQKKLEKKGKDTSYKIDQRLEKLEMKKKKLLEKVSLRSGADKKPVLDPGFGMPCIMSAMPVKECLVLPKKVTVGEVFPWIWSVINDGTLPWNNVELRHTWSTPGLEPIAFVAKCNHLLPAQQGNIYIKFRAPKTIGPFVSYWHFFHQVDSQWQQFGHYLSISGCTMSFKLTISTVTSDKVAVTDDTKMMKKKSKKAKLCACPAQQECICMQNAEAPSTLTEVLKEGYVKASCLSEEARQMCTKQLEASLASSQIAAEMAKEAADALLRAAIVKQATASANPSPTVADDQLQKCLDDMVELNLVDSGTDTDANNDTEDTDPGFVFVDASSVFTDEMQVDAEQEELGDKYPNLKNMKITFRNSDVPEDKEVNPVLAEETNDGMVEANESSGVLNSPVATENNAGTSAQPKAQNADVYQYENVDEPQQPMSFPRLDPNLNYPVFPPPRVVSFQPPPPLQHTLPHQHMPPPPPPPHGLYVVLPPANSSPQYVFPVPPPPMIYSGAKINPPMHFPQVPTYPPIPISSQPKPCPLTTVMSPIATAPSRIAMPPPYQMMPQATMPSQPTFSSQPGSKPTFLKDSNEMLNSSDRPNFPPGTEPLRLFHSQLEMLASECAESVSNPKTAEPLKGQPENPSEAEGPQLEAGDNNQEPESVVQILPQALVDGAINVATTAYSTAWNALNNLRNNDGKAVEFDPLFENNMAQLIDMGFNNLERNARLLKRYHNNINQVIEAICAAGGCYDLEID